MGPLAYYSPLAIGTVLAALLLATYRQHLPVMPGWQLALLAVAICAGAGLACQLLMVAAQGAFAQVLPAPGGRSIRGGGAVLAGWLLLIGLLFGFAAALLVAQGMILPADIAGAISLACLIATAITYIWCWPAAVRDFADDRE